MKWKINKPELVDFKLVDLNNIKALATIRVNGFLIKNIKIIQQGKQKPYIRLPETPFIKDGKPVYSHSFVFEDIELKKEVNKLLLFRYYKELIGKNKKRKE
jgi:hypothetical protein